MRPAEVSGCPQVFTVPHKYTCSMGGFQLFAWLSKCDSVQVESLSDSEKVFQHPKEILPELIDSFPGPALQFQQAKSFYLCKTTWPAEIGKPYQSKNN